MVDIDAAEVVDIKAMRNLTVTAWYVGRYVSYGPYGYQMII